MARTIGNPALLEGLGEHLYRAREAAGLTQSEVARRSGLDVSTVSDLENGRRNPSVMALAQIAAAVGLHLCLESANPQAADHRQSLESRVDALERQLLSVARTVEGLGLRRLPRAE